MRPFEGIRVLDLSHVLAGPFCTYQLALLGADVIKIEAPNRPDMTRGEGAVPQLNNASYGTMFLAQNGGKRAITLDLATPDGKSVMQRLVQSADVLFQNFAGPAVDRLGFGYEACAELNPKLIYATVTGYGRTGPKADHPAYDVVIQAFSGMMYANRPEGTPPARMGPPVVDYGTGAQAALAISAALLQRERTGQGQRVDVSMLDSALMLMSALVTDTLATGQSQRVYDQVHPAHAGYGAYPTADGTVMLGAYTTGQLANLMDAVGEPERAAQIRAQHPPEVVQDHAADQDRLTQRLATRSAQDWEDLLNDLHIPAARVRVLEEALTEPQIAERHGIQRIDTVENAPGSLPVAGFQYAHGGPSLDRAPPRLGEHNGEVLAELGYSADDIAQMRASGAI